LGALLFPGYPGLLLSFHIAAVFAEGDGERGERRAGCVWTLKYAASHRHHGLSDGRCPPPTSTTILAEQRAQNPISLRLNQERWANVQCIDNQWRLPEGGVRAFHPG